MSLHAPGNSKPNRSAKARREQQQRADTRAWSRLLGHVSSLDHRGNRSTRFPEESMSSFQTHASTTRTDDTLENQLA
eukprot:9812542-Karenia_brevis.AAC.1